MTYPSEAVIKVLVDEMWDFKSLNMGRELEIAGEFIYDSARKVMSITSLNNAYEINMILYTGAVGVERLQKVFLCLAAPDPTDKKTMPKCLTQHNHTQLQREVEKITGEQLSSNAICLLGMYEHYYNKYRYANYTPGQHDNDLQKLVISFFKKINGRAQFNESCTAAQFDECKRFYINELGKLAVYYFLLIRDKAYELNTYTYEIDTYSKASRVFLSAQRKTLYDQMTLEIEATKELLLYIYKAKSNTGVFQLLNSIDSLDFDAALVNEYLADLCVGNVNDSLIDYIDDLYEEVEDKKQRKERTETLSLIGNRSVWFDNEDDDVIDDEAGVSQED